jgi:hypothetical protein
MDYGNKGLDAALEKKKIRNKVKYNLNREKLSVNNTS